MRKKIIAGNWKMNKDLKTAKELTQGILDGIVKGVQTKIILGVPFPFLADVGDLIREQDVVSLAAQNIYPKDKGAYTGEISGPMLISCDVDYVIIGHSERRAYFHEDNAFVAKKLEYSISKGLRPILCIGEPLEVRDKNEHRAYVLNQLKECLQSLDTTGISELIIAYEPIWAIGTGRTASPDQAQEMHADIRSYLTESFGQHGAETPLLYGGSMKPENGASLLSCPDIDGGLIGGASLKAASFLELIKISENVS